MANAPGEPLTMGSKAKGMFSSASQSFDQISRICEHVCGFHFYAHDQTRQVHAHHLCTRVNEDFRQCIIYDSPRADARLIGIEYIISEKLFDGLPDDEKKYWHSHDYEVRGGSLAMPMPKGVPEAVVQVPEKQALATLQKTYGKTWHTWQVDRGDNLPYGPAQLMMALTADGQLDPKLDEERERDEGISTQKKKEERKDYFEPYQPHAGADNWQTGSAVQVKPEEVPFKAK
ncbi:duf1264-domain-containing protein [Lichtheimia corymbifera JMRC:FSU:9682]|uniref:Duf1264-domain-containing protein n=1 Tax=Lichtheimia corymbifera JMRC:FSU:9682 TaxID=1263082 RepID=A0A068S1U6_9FUNG|nr:duf1264-domain-containing protein [Lichtheimia corymbifera JMRC:FSU:9682]